MRIPRRYVEGYSDALNTVCDQGRSSLADALSGIDYTAPVAIVRDAAIALMQVECGASATMAALLAATFYDGMRARQGISDGFAAEADARREPEATEGAVRAFVQDLVDGKPPERFVEKCADRLDRETRLAANRCVEHNARRDPKKPKWARIPTGPETCEFCIMLASRGFVYHSEETASHAHANCDCRIVPSWDKTPEVEGYDPDLYYDMWKNPETHPELRAARNARRRELRAEKREQAQALNSEPIRIITARRAVGAKALNDYVIHIPGMEDSRFFPESDIEAKKIFAGAGSDPPIELRVAQRLSETYGDDPENWSHVAGVGWMFDPADGRIRRAEVHWMESPEAGIQEIYWKRWIEPEWSRKSDI